MDKNIAKIFKQKADYYDDILVAFNIYREAANSTNLELLKWLGDFAFFSLLGSYDLWIVLCDYQRSVKKFQQSYYARQASLICFELLSDLSQHLNDKYNSLCIDKIDDLIINEKSKSIRKTLNKLRHDNENKFKDIRDLTIAHREHDVSKQIDIINNMDNDWIMEFALNYLKEIEKLHELMNMIIAYIDKDGKKLKKDLFLNKYSV